MNSPHPAESARIRRNRFASRVTSGAALSGLLVLSAVSPASRTRTLSADFLSISSPAAAAPLSLTLSSPSFPNAGEIAKKFTCDGADVSPQLSWTDPPPRTQTFALLADDPDAPAGNWNHWTMWNLPSSSRGLPEAVAKDARLPDATEQGPNDFHKTGYNGPCPPPGKPHRYYFKLFALDTRLDLKPGTGKRELEAAMKGHILAQAEWMGHYGK